MTAQPTDDVRVHAHHPDLAEKAPQRGLFRRKSARPRARGRAISHLTLIDQEIPDDAVQESSAGIGAALADELAAARAAMEAGAAGSDWATEAMTPWAALKQITPRKGEAGNWILWSAMTVAGLMRAAGVSIGYLIARGFETRIRAGAAGTVFLIVILLATVAGQAR